jgi:hypothetical protein
MYRLIVALAVLSLCFETIALSPDDAKRIRDVEYKTNLNRCLEGYSYNCNHGVLSPDDAKRIRNAEYKTNLGNEKHKNIKFNRCAENGSCYGEISTQTGKPKTVSVRGYYRRNGTYVRGHYRSK